MLNFLRTDPATKLEKDFRKKMSDAAQAQRSGKMPRFAILSAEAEEIRKKIDDLKSKG